MEQVQQLRNTFGALPRRAQLAILSVAVVTVVVLFMVMRASTHTDWTTVVGPNAKPELVAKGQAALTSKKISSQVGTGGTSLMVHKGSDGDAVAALAAAGVQGHLHKDCGDQFSSSGGSFMSSTSAVMEVQMKTCLEGQIAKTIESNYPVKNADVSITQKSNTAFSFDQTSAAASITVEEKDGRLNGNQVKAIKSIAMATVPGLKSQNVTVGDSSGLLGIKSGSSAASDLTKKLDIEQQYNAAVENKLTAKFEQLAGAGKVVVSSNADLNMNQVHRQTKDYGGADNQQGPMASEHTKIENLNGASTVAVGPAGTGSNIATTPQTAQGTQNPGAGNSLPGAATGTTPSKQYQNADKAADYNNDVVVEDNVIAPGAVQENRIAVVVDTSVPAATVTAIKNSAQAWEGGHPNDSFAFDNAPIAQVKNAPALGTGIRRAALAAYFKWIVAGLGLIGMAFLLRRQLNQRTEELLYPIDEPYMLEQATFEPIPLAELEAAVAAATSVENQKRLELQRKVERIADEKPSDVATQLRGWMMDDADTYGYTQPAGRR